MTIKKLVQVEFLKDQQSPDFGNFSKGDKPFFDKDLADRLKQRKLVKIISDKEAKNGK